MLRPPLCSFTQGQGHQRIEGPETVADPVCFMPCVWYHLNINLLLKQLDHLNYKYYEVATYIRKIFLSCDMKLNKVG